MIMYLFIIIVEVLIPRKIFLTVLTFGKSLFDGFDTLTFVCKSQDTSFKLITRNKIKTCKIKNEDNNQ